MEYCKKCIFYDKEYDEMRQSGDDVVIVGKDQKEKHYCRMYDTAIPEKIVDGKAECEYHAE